MSDLLVPHRFRGPSTSGNGGWTAGALAARLRPETPRPPGGWPPVRVTLRLPPPLDTPLRVGSDGGRSSATAWSTSHEGDDPAGTAEALVAEAEVLTEGPAPVEHVDADIARDAREGYPGLRSHPFPECFACGPDRAEDDGLRIFPGPLLGGGGRPLVASTWTPHPGLAGDEEGRASLPVTWAALDCVGGWAGDLTDRMMVLGRMTAQVDSLPWLGEEHVVVGERLRAEGRRTFTAATLYDADGRVVARAEHVWVAVDPGTFR